MRQIEALIIDFDNTLVKTKGFIEKHLNLTLKRLGQKAADHQKIIDILKKNLPFEKIFKELFGEEKGKIILNSYRERAQETAYEATEGAVNLINKLKKREIPVVLTTNRLNLIDLRLEQAGFEANSFVAKFTPVFPKPDIHAYDFPIEFLVSMGIRKEKIKFLGDDTDDYRSVPEDLKNNFTGVLTGLDSREDFIKIGLKEDQIINNLNQFSDFK